MNDISHIIEGCKKQDRLSQEKLYRLFYPALFSLCKTFFEDNHDILTALNSGMLKVFKNIGQYDLSKGTFFNWAYTVVKYAALTQVRDKKTESSFESIEKFHDTALFNPFEDKQWNDIYLLLGKLPSTTRAICSLYYLEGSPIKEISASLDMKEGTVKWHLNESRKRLRIILQPNSNKSE